MKVKLNKKMCLTYRIRRNDCVMFAIDFNGNLLTEDMFVDLPNNKSCIVLKVPYENIDDTYKVVDTEADTLIHKHTYEPFKALFVEEKDEN